jgi:hypothetical protein
VNRVLPPLLAAASLLSLAACGGGGSSVTSSSGSSGGAQTLSYQNPANTAGQFFLKMDSASTSATLILDLVGPETADASTGEPSTPGLGVTFGFNVDTTKAVWATPSAWTTPYVANGSLFSLGSGVQLAEGWVAGGSLQGIVSNKGLNNQVNDIGVGVIGKIALTPVQGGTGGQVALSDNGLGTLLNSYGTTPVTVLVGTLTLN